MQNFPVCVRRVPALQTIGMSGDNQAEELAVYVFQSGGELRHTFECCIVKSAYMSEPQHVTPMTKIEALRLKYQVTLSCPEHERLGTACGLARLQQAMEGCQDVKRILD